MADLGSCFTTSYILSNKQQLAAVSLRLHTGSSQPSFIVCLCLRISKPSTSSSHFRLLYRLGSVAPGKTRVGDDLGLFHTGHPRASVPTGQLQTTSKHHHPAPEQLILYREWKFVVSNHSQSLQLTGLGKSLPLTYQQQSRFNYKRSVYSAHTKGTP